MLVSSCSSVKKTERGRVVFHSFLVGPYRSTWAVETPQSIMNDTRPDVVEHLLSATFTSRILSKLVDAQCDGVTHRLSPSLKKLRVWQRSNRKE